MREVSLPATSKFMHMRENKVSSYLRTISIAVFFFCPSDPINTYINSPPKMLHMNLLKNIPVPSNQSDYHKFPSKTSATRTKYRHFWYEPVLESFRQRSYHDLPLLSKRPIIDARTLTYKKPVNALLLSTIFSLPFSASPMNYRNLSLRSWQLSL